MHSVSLARLIALKGQGCPLAPSFFGNVCVCALG